jgi:hypothetical protein
MTVDELDGAIASDIAKRQAEDAEPVVQPIVLGTSVRAIEVEIARADKPALQDELVEQLEQADSLKCDIDEIKSQRKLVTSRIATLQRQLVTLRRIVDVDCETRLEGLEVVVVRLDTGAEIERRAARPDELQTSIPVAPAAGAAAGSADPVTPPPAMPQIGFFAQNAEGTSFLLTPAQADMIRPLLLDQPHQMIRAACLDYDDGYYLTGATRNVLIVSVAQEPVDLAEITRPPTVHLPTAAEVLG